MPPKISKKELEEQARLEEEKRQQEEKERLQKEEEERKKYGPDNLITGLQCVLTEYYVNQVVKQQNPRQFTADFIQFYLKKQEIQCNFRDIDIQMIVEYTLHNIQFALENQFDKNELYVFINIMWHVLLNDSPRLVPFREQQNDENEKDFEQSVKKHIASQKVDKSAKSDLQLLQNLLEKHSTDQSEKYLKIFSPEALQLIIKYSKNSYFAHYSLYQFVILNEQQNLDVFETIFVDEPQPVIEGLNDAIYEPLDNYKSENQNQEQQNQENQDQDQQNGEKQEEEDEEEEQEELDPISQQIIQQKIREAQLNIEKQLEERDSQHKAKIEELQLPKGKKK